MMSKGISCLSLCGIYKKNLKLEEKNNFRRILELNNTADHSDNYFTFDSDNYLIVGRTDHLESTTDPVVTGGAVLLFLPDSNQLANGSELADWFLTEVSGFNSSWAACLIDDRNDQLLLARDSAGAQTLYAGYMDGVLVFTSSLTHLKNLGFGLNYDAVANLLHFLYVPAPLTMFEGITAVMPGESVLYNSCKLLDKKKIKPFEKISDNLIDVPPEELLIRYESLLVESAQKHSIKTGKLGLFLSGGKDSSVLSIAVKLAGLDNVEAITLGFSDRSIDEGEDARHVTKHFGIPLRLMRFSEDEYLSKWTDVVNSLGQPMGDFAVLPVYAAIGALGDEFKLFWDGTGSDSSFGIPATYQEALGWWLNRSAPFLKRFPWNLFPRGFSYSADKLISILHGYAEEQFVSWNGWSGEEISCLTGSKPDFSSSYLYQIYAECRTPIEHKTRTLCEVWEPENAYRKVVQSANSQASVVRFPFLDKRLTQFTRNLPESQRYFNRQNKILIRALLAKHLPEHIVAKPKGSFMFPKQYILNGRNFELIKRYLSDSVIKNHRLVDAKIAGQYVKEYMQGNKNLEDRIWILLMLHTWLEIGKLGRI